MSRDFNLGSVHSVSWRGHTYPVLKVMGKDRMLIKVDDHQPYPEGAQMGLIRNAAIVSAAGLVLHRGHR